MQRSLTSFFMKKDPDPVQPNPKWIIDLDCGTCSHLGSDWKKEPCLGCAAWNRHKPNWNIIKEQNERQQQWEQAFCPNYQYKNKCWDCGYLSCTNCIHFESEHEDKCLEGFSIINNEDKTKTTKIYGQSCCLVTPDNQKEVHAKQKYHQKRMKKQSRLGCEECHWFDKSFIELPCGNCIQDFYQNKKHTLYADELFTKGSLLHKKGIWDLPDRNEMQILIWEDTNHGFGQGCSDMYIRGDSWGINESDNQLYSIDELTYFSFVIRRKNRQIYLTGKYHRDHLGKITGKTTKKH